MVKTFQTMTEEAMAEVTLIKPLEAQKRMQQNPNTLLIDVRDAADIAATGTIPGAMNISYGALTYKADLGVPVEWREPELRDRARPIITTCILGPLGAIAGKLLQDMGFKDVAVVEGGVQAWMDAGLATA